MAGLFEFSVPGLSLLLVRAVVLFGFLLALADLTAELAYAAADTFSDIADASRAEENDNDSEDYQ
jgi:hypothetical protein